MSKRRRDAIDISSSKLDCVNDFCSAHKKLIERFLSGVTRARSDVIAQLTKDPAALVLSYLDWGAASDFAEIVDILKDIVRRNMAILCLYDRLPGFQHDPLMKGFRNEIKQVSIRS
jgi:hypothetical protein